MSMPHADQQPQVERRGEAQAPGRQTGVVVSVTSTAAVLAMRPPQPGDSVEHLWSVGCLVTIYGRLSRVICFVRSMDFAAQPWRPGAGPVVNVQVELLGEIVDATDGRPSFRRGIAHFPQLGTTANRIRKEDLAAIYDLNGRKGSVIGTLSQDSAIPAAIDVEGMLRKHFAVVGTTGVGKSSAVSILLRAAIDSRPDLRVIIVDPHNEYSHAFPDVAHTVESHAFELPFWLFRFEEIVEVIYRGARAPTEEVDFLRDAIPQARAMYSTRGQAQPGSILKKTLRDEESTSGDAAQPYRMTDVLHVIDEAQGRLEQTFSRSSLRALRVRIESLINDPSYRFMFGRSAIDGLREPVINRLFRLAEAHKPITILQLAGIPADVVNASVSVLARLAFELSVATRGRHEILLTCEEAHRYVPADAGQGFDPTRRALARIAKEGRKYGCYLGIVTQRPSELDPTILSQCSTVFAMRLSNAADQDIIRSAMPDAAVGVLEFLSALSNRETIAFGEAISTPMRLYFTLMSADQLPKMGEDAGDLRVMTQAEAGFDLMQEEAALAAARQQAAPVLPQAGGSGATSLRFPEPQPLRRDPWDKRPASPATPTAPASGLRPPPGFRF